MKIYEKKAVTMFVLALLMASLVFVQVGFAQIGYAYIAPVETHVNVCEDFVVTVFAFVEVPIKAFEFGLVFDPTQMSVVKVTFIPPWVQAGLNVLPGYIYAYGIDVMVGPGPVPLVDIVFHCDASGTSALLFEMVLVQDMEDTWWQIPWEGASVYQYDLYWKPPQIDYAPSGVPDFDQRQWLDPEFNWTNPYPPVDSWSFCGPTAVANSLWWLDSQFEPDPVPPPEINDGFPLVESYNPGVWDDHDPQNVPYLIEDLAWFMNTNDLWGTGSMHCGTTPTEMQMGIDMYLEEKGLDWKFYEHTEKAPDFYWIEEQVEICEDVILLLGFWQTNGVDWWRPGGHYVTAAGVDSTGMYLAVSDPFRDAAEFGGIIPGQVLPPGHGPGDHPVSPPETLHNNATYVSHDIYQVGLSPSPGGEWGLVNYYAEEEGFIDNFDSCQNLPEEFVQFDDDYIYGLPVYTEIEYAIIVSCETGRVAVGSEDGMVYVHDFYGNLLWNWGTEAYCVSVAFDNDARYLAGGWRYSDYGELNFFDVNAVTGGGWNPPLWSKSLVISESHAMAWGSRGNESMSVDVKYNFYNQSYIVAAAHDHGLNLYDEWGNLIWQYFDEWPETIVRISQDGNYLVCADTLAQNWDGGGTLHYFSHLRDGVPGWGPGDGTPLWSAGGQLERYSVHWTAISGIGDYVAVSGWEMSEGNETVVLLNRTGGEVWSYVGSNPEGGAVTKVDMPCHGRSIVAVTEDLYDWIGCDLLYFDDGGDGWDSGDGTPVWTYWPGKEFANPHNPSHDFFTVSISENGDFISTGGDDGTSNLYLFGKDSTLLDKENDGVTVQSVDQTFAGQYGVVGSCDSGYAMYDKGTGTWAWMDNAGDSIRSVAISKIYPCMFPFPDHDLAVVDVTHLKTVVTQGLCMFINATVENQGDFTETNIGVTAYANETAIQSLIIPNLAPGANTTVTFTWNASGFAKGNYTLSAVVNIVYNEIDVYDNRHIDGTVTVSCKGDITGPTPNVPDGTVNMRDISLVAKGFGASHVTNPASPNFCQYWHGTPCVQCPHSANCDLTGPTPGLPDGTINMRDIALVAKLFGTGGC